MPEPTRKLAAIMFTDIVGYTAMMGESETKTLDIRRRNREIHQQRIEASGGSWLKEMGDGTLASFTTITDAVKCAVEIRQACKQELDIELKIGIHIGEVVYEDGDVFGDGVNIASRIQQLADRGGILISEPVFNDIKNKGDFNASFIGEASLKNVDTPVKVYQVLDADLVTPSIKLKKSGKLNKLLGAGVAIIVLVLAAIFIYQQYIFEEPIGDNSIAVLPFKNLSSDEDDQYFTDGLLDGILRHLSSIKDIDKLISRTTTEQYRETTKTIPEIATELKVAYILEGSVQKVGNKVRITAQLIDAEDKHVWSEDYDRELIDVFAVQTEISKEVANALSVELTSRELQQIEAIPTQNPEAHDLYVKGHKYYSQFFTRYDPIDFETAKRFFEQALELDPDFTWPLIEIADMIIENVGQVTREFNYLDTALNLYHKAIAINPDSHWAYLGMGDLYYWKTVNTKNNYIQEAKDAYYKVRELAPGLGGHNRNLTVLHSLTPGRSDSVAYYAKKEILDSPNSSWGYRVTAQAYVRLDMLVKAKEYINEALKMVPDGLIINSKAMYIYKLSGDFQESLKYQIKVYEINQGPSYLSDLIDSYILVNDYIKAEEYVLKGLEIISEEGYNETSQTPWFRMQYGHLLWQKGEQEEAMKYFNQQIELSEKFGQHGHLARIYSFLGDTEKAYRHLKESFEWPYYYTNVLTHPMYANMRNDERIQQLIVIQKEGVAKMRGNLEIMEASDELKRYRKL